MTEQATGRVDWNGEARIVSVGLASPPFVADQAEAEAYFLEHGGAALSPRSRGAMHKLFSHPSIRHRRFAIDEREGLIGEDPDRRIDRFTRWAIDLSAAAVREALAGAEATPERVSALVVNTCTGYICPGLSTYLVERLGLSRAVRAYDLVGAGCGGAIPNIELAAGALADGGVVVSVSVEICSATLQMADDLSLLVSNAIFADGAAAAVLTRDPAGRNGPCLALVGTARRLAPEHREHIRYVYKRGQLHNQLSVGLPKIARGAVGEAVGDLLRPHGLRPADVRHWALHPGGEKVINAVRDELGLTEEQVAPSRRILAEYGNMSSATVWFVLRDILSNGVAPGDWCVMLAFGAGLSAHAALLRA